MVGVNLKNANRLNENLTGANLTGANLTGANLAQVKLDGAIGLYQWPGMGENCMQSPRASHGSRQQAFYNKEASFWSRSLPEFPIAQ